MKSPLVLYNQEHYMKKHFFIVGSILFSLILVACASTQTTPETTVIIATQPFEENLSYPAPQDKETYPPPVQEGDSQISQGASPDITPDPNLAIVKGVMLYNTKPMGGVILYLSEVIYDDKDNKWVSFERQASTRTITNQLGEFRFDNISPGEFGLVLDAISTSYLLSTPDGKGEIIVDLSPGDVINLGVLDYNNLPIPEP